MLELLPLDEQQELAHCEAVIERGLETFFEVGQAMAIIRDRKLYRADFKTFEEYCRDRWGMRRQVANRFIAASETVANLEPIGSIPASESQARPLTSLEPDQQRKAWSKVVQEAQASGKPITAAKVRAVVDTFKSTSQPYQEQKGQYRIYELTGKALGAHCYPEKCHCEVLREWAEKGG